MMAVVMTNLENKKNKKPEAPKPAPTPKVQAAADKVKALKVLTSFF